MTSAPLDFDPTDPVALAQALIRCESVTPLEGGALALLQSILEPRGFRCHRLTMREPGTPDVENLYARFGEGRPNLCFAGHTDVVPAGDAKRWRHPPFGGVIEDGVLYGRGAVDMKGAIAAFVAGALQHMASPDSSHDFDISLLITGDEEGPSINGTAKVLDWLAARGEKLDAAIVGEPTNPTELGQEIKIGRRGSLTGDILVHGKQGHVAYPQLADNPVPKLVSILNALSGHSFDTGNADFEPTNLEVTIIEVSNTATNVIPAEAGAKFNVRYNSEWTRPRLEAEIGRLIAEAAATASARFDLAFSGTGDVFLTRPGPLVDAIRQAVESVTGRIPALTTNGGTSDARFIQAYCPVIEFGLINQLAHHIDESVAVADLQLLTGIYRRFLQTWRC